MIDITKEVLLDLRELEPPEPFVQSLAALERLLPGQYLHLVHHRAPAMLYPELAPRGFVSQTQEHSSGLFHIVVWRETDDEAKNEALSQLERMANT
ncbi:MAG: DUF2249 domain-containing protein [Pseudomonadales bacterium]|nr:DUF2249 domain-containing protein [Pseudomonadales bacterium]